MNISNFANEIIIRVKNNLFILCVAIGVFIVCIIMYSSIKLNVATNKTSSSIQQLNKKLGKHFGNVQGLRQNPDYQQALIDYSDPDDAVTKSYSGYCLRDFYIASSTNSIISRKIYNGFINADMIGVVLANGARLITLDIFSDSYCDDGKPVVSNNDPSYKYIYNQIGTFNYVDFDVCCQKIITNAFTKTDDPLILSLKLHLNKLPEKNKEGIVEQLTKIITKRFKGRLLGPDYSYQRTIIGNAPIEDLFGKIIILCDHGFAGTSFDELVNYSWDQRSTIAKDSKAPLFMLHYTSTQMNGVSSQGFDLLKIQNKKGMCIVDADSGTSSMSVNYNIAFAWEAGCQCVGIDYFNSDSVKVYKDKFSEYSFVLKPEDLRYIQEYITYNSYQNPDYSMEPRKIESSSGFGTNLQI